MLLEKAIQYAKDVADGKEITTKEVKIQCNWVLEDYNKKQHNNDFKYYFDKEEITKIENILKLLNFATGLNVVGTPILYGLHNFQAFFICNVFGWRFKEDTKKFRYRDNTLFIPRKNAKTFVCALIVLILMLTEENYSEFYSICLDRELAGKVKEMIVQILNASPAVGKYFKTSTTLSGKIICKITNSYYQARTAEANRNNSIRPSAFIADEIGAFRDYKNINAMKSGQLSVRNPLRFKITTAYAESESIMLEELEYIRGVYNGIIDDDRMFALLYYAEEEHKWDDIGLQQANPLRIEENYQEIKDNRKTALAKPSEQVEFLTKHMNIFVNSIGGDKYIDFSDWQKCRTEKIDLEGKEVVVGVDLSLTTDLTAVDIMYKENGKYYLAAHAFLPEDTLEERREKIDYRLMEQLGYCTITKGKIVDYRLVEDYIRSIEDKYNCRIKCIASDPYNALQMMQSLGEDYEVIFLKQTYTVLSPPIKSFREDVYKGNIIYQQNKILDWCMQNTETVEGRTSGDILLNKKNKNKTRIDLVVAAIFCYSQLYLQEEKPTVSDKDIEDWLNKVGV